MTHTVDCRVEEDKRDVVDEVAALFDRNEEEAALDLADDLGWEFVGGGAGRRVFRVDVTDENPCVIKFASGRGRFAGDDQNREEIATWESLPQAAKDADPPVFVPVRDWADNKRSWLSMPLAQPGGDEHEASVRAHEVGMNCDADLHSDNVGVMHGESVILDYGVDCIETAKPVELKEELVAEVEQFDVSVDQIVDLNGGFRIEWETPAWATVGSVAPPTNGVFYTFERGVGGAKLYFGMWDDSLLDDVQHVGEIMAEEIEDSVFSALVRPGVEFDDAPDGDGEAVGLELDIELQPHDGIVPVEEFGRIYDIVLDVYDEQAAERLDHAAIGRSIRFMLDQTGVVDIEVDDGPDDGSTRVTFFPPPETPMFAPNNRSQEPLKRKESTIFVEPGGVGLAQFVFGPWRGDEPRRPTLGMAADEVNAELLATLDEAELSWRIWDLGGREYVFFDFNTVGDALVGKEAIVDLYERLVDLVVSEFPPARGEGEPRQETLTGVARRVESDVDTAIVEQQVEDEISEAIEQ